MILNKVFLTAAFLFLTALSNSTYAESLPITDQLGPITCIPDNIPNILDRVVKDTGSSYEALTITMYNSLVQAMTREIGFIWPGENLADLNYVPTYMLREFSAANSAAMKADTKDYFAKLLNESRHVGTCMLKKFHVPAFKFKHHDAITLNFVEPGKQSVRILSDDVFYVIVYEVDASPVVKVAIDRTALTHYFLNYPPVSAKMSRELNHSKGGEIKG